MRTSSQIVLVGCALLGAACVTEEAPPPARFRFLTETSSGTFREVSSTRGAEVARGPRPLARSSPKEATAERELRAVSGAGNSQDFLEAEVVKEPIETHPSSFHAFQWNLIRQPDGSLTKSYYFRAGKPGAQRYVKLLRLLVPGFSGLQEGQDYWVDEGFLEDPRQPGDEVSQNAGATTLPFGAGKIGDMLMVSAPEELLHQIDDVLDSLLGEAPQIEIETTIVEITLNDGLDIGLSATLTRGTEEDPRNNLVDEVTLNLAKGLVNGTFGTFSALHDGNSVTGLLELLQSTSEAQVLSSPKLAVLNGHRAVIDTGSEIPFFQPDFTNRGVGNIKTEFKPTGIKVVVQPFILSSDMVQLEIAVEVSNVTGFVTAGVGSGSEVENPLISRRNASTVINVPTAKTVLIGGLDTNDEVETVQKVPILGDIPLLGYFFKSKSTTYRKAQVMFFVKPTIKYGSSQATRIFDPLTGSPEQRP